MCAIDGSLPSELPLCSDFNFQLSDFLIAPTSRSPQSTQTTLIARPKPTAAPRPQQCLSDPELTSLIPWRLLISHSSQNRTPHGRNESGFSFLVPIYPDACRDDCKGNLQRSHTLNPNQLALLHFPSSDSYHTTLVHFNALWTFPVCAHLHGQCVPTHSQVDTKASRATVRSSGVDSQIETRATWRSGKCAWRFWREVDAGAREWGGQHPVAAQLIPLRPTCHVKFEFQRPIMIASPPFMSLNFRRFLCFCTVA